MDVAEILKNITPGAILEAPSIFPALKEKMVAQVTEVEDSEKSRRVVLNLTWHGVRLATREVTITGNDLQWKEKK